MGTQNGYNVPFLESASLRKRKRKAAKRINKNINYLKRVLKKIVPSGLFFRDHSAQRIVRSQFHCLIIEVPEFDAEF